MISVLIADDHAIVRKGLVQIASESREIEMRGEASEYSSLIDRKSTRLNSSHRP